MIQWYMLYVLIILTVSLARAIFDRDCFISVCKYTYPFLLVIFALAVHCLDQFSLPSKWKRVVPTRLTYGPSPFIWHTYVLRLTSRKLYWLGCFAWQRSMSPCRLSRNVILSRVFLVVDFSYILLRFRVRSVKCYVMFFSRRMSRDWRRWLKVLCLGFVCVKCLNTSRP